jgi:hypothetical protein
MAAQLRSKPGADTVAVTIGDMTTTRVPGPFRLVYLLGRMGQDPVHQRQHRPGGDTQRAAAH